MLNVFQIPSKASLPTSLSDRWFRQILCWHSDVLYPQQPLLPAKTASRQQEKIWLIAEGEFIWETKLWAVFILGVVSDTDTELFYALDS
jgi:hypothetical protein